MTDLGFQLEDIAKLISIVEKKGLAEIVVEEGERRICVRGSSYQSHQSVRTIASPAQIAEDKPTLPMIEGTSSIATVPAFEAPPQIENRTPLCSPMVGVFYRTPGPDIPSYVEVGDHVVAGQTVGIIEAMKVFSEIPAEISGTIVEIVTDSGVLVKPNEPIMYIIAD